MIKKAQGKITHLLLWSQRYTHIDMLYVARGSFWTMFSQVLNGVLSLGLLVAFANMLPKETYGSYRYILSIASVLNICTLTGMSTALSRSVARGDEILQSTIGYQLRWNTLMLAGFLAVSGYYYVQGDAMLGLSFLILGTCIPASIAFNTSGAYLEGKKEFRILNIMRVISTALYVVGTLVAIFLNGEILGLIIAYALTTLFTSLLFYLYTVRTFAPPQTTDATETIAFARELTYLKFIDPIASQIDKIVIGHFWGPAQLAIYSLATALPNRVILFMKSLVNIGFPKFSVKTPEMLNAVFYKRIVQGILIGFFVSLAYIAVAPYLYRYVLPQYVDGVVYSQWFALIFIFAIPNRYISLLLSSQRMSKVLRNRAFAQSIINVVLYVVLGVWGGLAGLIAAGISINIISLILNIWLWRRVSAL